MFKKTMFTAHGYRSNDRFGLCRADSRSSFAPGRQGWTLRYRWSHDQPHGASGSQDHQHHRGRLTRAEPWGTSSARLTDTPATDPTACDAFIGQPDGLAYLARTNRAKLSTIRQFGALHREYAHVVCSRESGVTKLQQQIVDNPTKYKVALGNSNSGAWLLWQNWVDAEKKLGGGSDHQ
jgi:hypothetical protein